MCKYKIILCLNEGNFQYIPKILNCTKKLGKILNFVQKFYLQYNLRRVKLKTSDNYSPLRTLKPLRPSFWDKDLNLLVKIGLSI